MNMFLTMSRNSTPHPKIAYARLVTYNFAVRCMPVGRQGTGSMGNIWSPCCTRTGSVSPRQAESIRSIHCRLVYRQATSRSNQWTMDEVSQLAMSLIASITALCSCRTSGLQCHTAPFSWKIVFECDCQLYEMMLTACNPKEEDEWRCRLEIGADSEPQDGASPELYGSLFLNMKSLSTVFGKQGEKIHNLVPPRRAFLNSYRYHCAQDIYPKSDHGWPENAALSCCREKY